MELMLQYVILLFELVMPFELNCLHGCKCSSWSGEMVCNKVNTTLQDFSGSVDLHVATVRIQTSNLYFQTQENVSGYEYIKSFSVSESFLNFVSDCAFCRFNNLQNLELTSNVVIALNGTCWPDVQYPTSLLTLKVTKNFELFNSDNFRCPDDLYYPDLSYLSHLEELYLDGLHNTSFPASYRDLKQLKTVVLSGLQGHCDIGILTNETLANLVYVRKLNISSCKIRTIDSGAFESLRNLEVLDLSKNLQLGLRVLRNVSYGLQFTNIQSLNVSNIQLTFGLSTQILLIDFCYLRNTSLKELVLNSNRIEQVENNALILLSENLEILHVEDNRISFAPYLYQIGCLSKLTELHVSFQNNVHDPFQYVFQPKEESIDKGYVGDSCPFADQDSLNRSARVLRDCLFISDKMNANELAAKFPTSIRLFNFASSGVRYNLPVFRCMANNVTHVDVSGNIFYNLTGPFGSFPKVKYLDLSKNYCSFISTNFFEGWKSLENFQSSENLLGLALSDKFYGPVIFQDLVNLRVLNISSNIISYIPPTVLSNMTYLETLDISVNNLKSWNVSVDHLHHLLNVNLSNNAIQTLPKTLTEKLENNSKRLNKSFSIDLRNNPIRVTCAEKEFVDWMVKHKENFLFFEQYNFQNSAGPPFDASHIDNEVRRLDKACKSYTLEIIVGTAGVSVFLAIVIGGFVYRNRWNVRYLMRLTKLRQFGYKRLNNAGAQQNYNYDAFVSYANENCRFLLEQIIPNLENRGFRLCLHDRDFLPGNYIADNIVSAVRNSKTTLVILSRDFLRSNWCLYEFNMARMESIYSRGGSTCLLVVMLEEVPTVNMPTEMIEWIRTNTYLEYASKEPGRQLFWDSLLEALAADI